MYVDIHSHILPGIDDGSSSIEETKKLLLMQKRQGIGKVIATPHYDAELSDAPLKHYNRCNRILERLKNELNGGDFPEVELGFEVRYFRGMSKSSGIEKMTLGDTKYMLLEMNTDYSGYTDVEEVVDLSLNFGVMPIFAHIERYYYDEMFPHLLEIIDLGYAEAQINADSLLQPKLKKVCLKLLKNEHAKYIATDTHSVSMRPPHLDLALEVLNKKFGKEATVDIMENSSAIFKR